MPSGRGSERLGGQFHTAVFIAVFLACASMAACGEADAPKPKNFAQEMLARDRELMKGDFNSASQEFERRLATNLRLKDGLLLVRDPDPLLGRIALYVLPPKTSWTISCGMGGLSVTFGNSVSGGGVDGGSANDVEVRLAWADLEPRECDELAPRIGKQVLELAGASQ
jgi:hypothetical protein